MVIGVDCCEWNAALEMFCGAPARWMRFDADRQSLVAILCDRHHRAGDVMIPAAAERAPRADDRKGRYFTP